MSRILDYLKDNILILDGGFGTMLQAMGMQPGEGSEAWNLSHPDAVSSIHSAYYEAGSNAVSTNTFGINPLKYDEETCEKMIAAAVEAASTAKAAADPSKERFILFDVGPLGRLLKPYGDLDFEEAVKHFTFLSRMAEKYDADAIFIETMTDSYETKAALLAAKESTSLPVFVSNAYGEDGKLLTGADAAASAAMLQGLHADAIGVNCSLGPRQLFPVVETLLERSSVPVIFKPNAGLPVSDGETTTFDITSDEFADAAAEMVKKGVRLVGGCCGTTPEYIRKVAEKIANLKPAEITEKHLSCISSYTHAIDFGKTPLLIGERINPTGKKRFKQALMDKDMDYILQEGIRQQELGAHILDVNVGLPGIDETAMMKSSVYELQAVLDTPLQIDTSDPQALEAALRIYNGKPLINSVNGKEESMRTVFPLVKKYGGVTVALTLDEDGIPATAEGRYAIAEKILKTAREYGLSEEDLLFDPLTMTVATDQQAAAVTLKALKMIHDDLHCGTLLGVSNVSFGLPERGRLNSAFFMLAMENGLSGAIMNPGSTEMMSAYKTFRLLRGMDENCTEYVGFVSSLPKVDTTAVSTKETAKSADLKYGSELQEAVVKGRQQRAADLTKALLKDTAPLDIIRNDIVPALNIVGQEFEKKTVYLPQLLMSAEAAKQSFDVIKAFLPPKDASASKTQIVIATVHGDIHDIGKNIVKLLLENYGFSVLDLGKDVPEEDIVEAVKRDHVPLCGLSALMTTTVPAMERTIQMLHEEAPWCKTFVGGAVLNEDYAKRINADMYTKDAMASVRYCQEELGN